MGSVLEGILLNLTSHMNQLHHAQSNSSKARKQNPPTLSATSAPTSPAILSSGWGWVWVGCCSPAAIVAPPQTQRHGGLFERRVAQGYPIWCFGNSCIGLRGCRYEFIQTKTQVLVRLLASSTRLCIAYSYHVNNPVASLNMYSCSTWNSLMPYRKLSFATFYMS